MTASAENGGKGLIHQSGRSFDFFVGGKAAKTEADGRLALRVRQAERPEHVRWFGNAQSYMLRPVDAARRG